MFDECGCEGLQVWKTLDEVHLLSKSRKGRKQRSSVKDGVDQDALELADAELLLLDEVIVDAGNAVDMREAHEDFAALATVASASRHGSTPGPAAGIAGRAAAATSADLMAKTPLSRMGSARSDAGAASAFRLGACAVDGGTGALMLGGQGGVALLGAAGAGLGLGLGGACGVQPGASVSAITGLGTTSDGGGLIGALSFMDGSVAMADSPTGTASTRRDAADAGAGVGGDGAGYQDYGIAGGFDDGGGVGGYDDAEGGWFGPAAVGTAGRAASRRRPRGLDALWAAGPYGEGDDAADAGEAGDDPWLALDIHDAADSVLAEAKAAGCQRLVRSGKSRPMRSAKTTARPASAAAVAAAGCDRPGGVPLPARALEALAKAGAIGVFGAASGVAALAVGASTATATTEAAFAEGALRAARASGIPAPVSLAAAAPALPEFRAGFEAARARAARQRLQAARRGPVGGIGAGRMFAEDDGDNDYDDAEAGDEAVGGYAGGYAGGLGDMDDDGGGGFGGYDANDADADEDVDGRAAARAALFGAGHGPAEAHLDGFTALPPSSGAGEADSYEALVLRHRDEFMAAAEEAVGRSAMAVRVAAWTEHMSRALEEEEARGAFDVHAYGGGVISAMVAAGAVAADDGDGDEGQAGAAPVGFEEVLRCGAGFSLPRASAEEAGDGDDGDDGSDDAGAGGGGRSGTAQCGLGGSAPQVARSFLALLQLANAGSVQLVHAGDEHSAARGALPGPGDGLAGHLGVRLLTSASPTAYLDRMADVAACAAALNGAAPAPPVPPSAPPASAAAGVSSAPASSTSRAGGGRSREAGSGSSRLWASRSSGATRSAGSSAAATGDEEDEELDPEAYSDDEAGAGAPGRTRAVATPGSGGHGRKSLARVKGATPSAKRGVRLDGAVALSMRQSLAVVGHDSDSESEPDDSDSDAAGNGIDPITMAAAASVVFQAAGMGSENASSTKAPTAMRARGKRALAPLPQAAGTAAGVGATGSALKSPATKRPSRRRAAPGGI